jgi:putative colanic acid biosynthesis UDP-glucose lipid carrier transferase
VIPGTLMADGCYSLINGLRLQDFAPRALHEPLSRLACWWKAFAARKLMRSEMVLEPRSSRSLLQRRSSVSNAIQAGLDGIAVIGIAWYLIYDP